LLVLLGAKNSDYLFDMSAPTIQRLFSLGQKFVALVDGRHSRNRPLLVVENLIGNMRRHSKPGHTRNYGSSEIVEPPSGDAGEFVKRAL
jgi:hypothetical protein